MNLLIDLLIDLLSDLLMLVLMEGLIITTAKLQYKKISP